jgi:exoribonuclease-2
MQRRLLNRFVLGHSPEKHSGLGLDGYVTCTSPIRKYFDLVTQRQIRAFFGFEEPYRSEDIDWIIRTLEPPMGNVMRLQATRHRYWLLKYLERRAGQKEEAIVLVRRRNAVQVLLTEYMLECDLPLSGGIKLKPEDLIQVTIQRVNARRDTIDLAIG